ncbi:MAG: plasmid maintenance system killer protein [Phage 67_12]|nr:MAG: plasmid maintenance system killer protein [Phage 67_12]
MIKSFQHSGLEDFFKTGSKAGIQPAHEKKLRLQLAALNSATGPNDLGAAIWHLRLLQGEYEGFWSIRVSGNWRVIFTFDGKDVVLVDYLDYH